ncbi:UNKNOWN [Stylonychia lemnae]|uniref:Uncharacterized protein n=1 Tax=Stylonychia lemnae TaxID=5949 RepID=A0A078B3Y7_STYLE|nr:UNKNOWN [Stylonychia lemnae]|eukprot:CDW87897.1 UNKNOWN [Stylonychia lemnae]
MVIRVFDGDLSETKQEALQKFRERHVQQMLNKRNNPFGQTQQKKQLWLQNGSNSISRANHNITGLRKNSDQSDSQMNRTYVEASQHNQDLSHTITSSINNLRLNHESPTQFQTIQEKSKLQEYDEFRNSSRLEIDSPMLGIKNDYKKNINKNINYNDSFETYQNVKLNKTFMITQKEKRIHHNRFRSSVNGLNQNDKKLKQQIFDNTQEKLINNQKFFRVTHSSQNQKRQPGQINYRNLQSLPKQYQTFYSNKANYIGFHDKVDGGKNLQQYFMEQSNIKNTLELNKKALVNLEKKCDSTLASLTNRNRNMISKYTTMISNLQTPDSRFDHQTFRTELENEIKSGQVYKQTIQILKMERKHERKMKDFKEVMNKKYQAEVNQNTQETGGSTSPKDKKLSTIKKKKKDTRGLNLEVDDDFTINVENTDDEDNQENAGNLLNDNLSDYSYQDNDDEVNIFTDKFIQKSEEKNPKFDYTTIQTQNQNRVIETRQSRTQSAVNKNIIKISKRADLKERINKMILSRNLKPGQSKKTQMLQSHEVSKEKIVFNTKKGQILYTQDSLKRLLNNDSLKYERSMKAVVDEFMEFSSKSYYFISNRLKNTKCQF